MHTHDDRALLIGDMGNKTSQGVTSVVVGNCGISLAPLTLRDAPPPPLDLIGAQADYRYPTFADYMAALDRQPPAVNAACLVGHSTLRVGVMDRLDRPATGERNRGDARTGCRRRWMPARSGFPPGSTTSRPRRRRPRKCRRWPNC